MSRRYRRTTVATACRQAAQLADAGSRLAALERDLERRQEQVRAAEATAATHNAREEVRHLKIQIECRVFKCARGCTGFCLT